MNLGRQENPGDRVSLLHGIGLEGGRLAALGAIGGSWAGEHGRLATPTVGEMPESRSCKRNAGGLSEERFLGPQFALA